MTNDNHVTVVAAVIHRGDRVLMQQRLIHREFPYTWEFPGGKVEDRDIDETDALWRELNEELGFTCVGGLLFMNKPVFVTTFHPPLVRTACTLKFFEGRAFDDWKPQAHDAMGFGWFTYEQAVRMKSDLTPGNQRMVEHMLIAGGW